MTTKEIRILSISILMVGLVCSAEAVHAMSMLVSRSSDDTYLQRNDPNSNFDGQVGPSTNLRDANEGGTPIIRPSLYRFPLPVLPSGESVSQVDLRLVVFGGGDQWWNVAIGKLTGATPNPDLSMMTWNTAIADGYLGSGQIVGNGLHQTFGANSTGTNDPSTGEWVITQGSKNYMDGGIEIYSDTDASDGLAKDVG